MGSPGKRLLSLDDDVSILSIIKEVATPLGFEVTVLSDSTRFMTTYVRLKPDVITLDVMMPDMDGIEVIRWLGDIGSTASIIIISGHSVYLKLGKKLADVKGSLTTTLLRKPFSLVELRAALTTAA